MKGKRKPYACCFYSGLFYFYNMIKVTLPIMEIGRTSWYQIITADFYTFSVSLLTHYSADAFTPPKHFTLFRKEKNHWEFEPSEREVKQLLIEEIEAWITNNVVVIPT